MKIRIGTRKSKLAMWQAEWVKNNLEKGGAQVELVPIITKGDKVLDVSISKIGSKGVFTEELENLLVTGAIDIAVHSAKDMQSRLPDGFEISAFSKKEKSNDVLVSNETLTMNSEGITLGTSSTRRVAFLKHFYPHIKIVEMRGNLQTRLSKMSDGACDGLILAAAGVIRMNYQHLIQEELPVDEFTPPVGQGSIAIENHIDLDPEIKDMVRKFNNDPITEKCIRAERSFLATMDGGCSIPIFGNAKPAEEGIEISGGIISLNGQQVIRKNMLGEDASKLGKQLANEVLKAGGEKILREIRTQL